jgi:peptide/nickel transport system substrate-binding protein
MKKLLFLISLLSLIVISVFVVSACAPAAIKGGVLKIGAWPDGGNIGMPSALAMNQFEFGYAGTSLEMLVRVDEKGALVPWLATAWKEDATAKTITFTLRKGVKFQDGADWNAKACKWNFDKLIPSKQMGTTTMDSAEVVDDYTVRLKLKEWDSTVIYWIAEGPVGLMVSPTSADKNGADWAQKNPVGTGPFQLVSWQRDVKQTYKKFDGYWQSGKPYLDGLEWVMIQDPVTKTMSFQNGEVDLITEVDFNAAKKMEGNSKYIINKATPAFLGIAVDSKNADSPFAKLKVRQAVEYAIDKKAICDSVAMGYWTPVYQLSIPGSLTENKDVKGYQYDPNKAKQLLAEAGYPSGLKATIYMANVAPYNLLFPPVQSYLKAVGMDAEIKTYDSAGYVPQVMMGTWSNGMTGIATQAGDAVKMLTGTYDPNTLRWKMKAIPQQLWDLCLKARSAPDFDTKKGYIQQATKVVYDDATVNWVAQINALAISNNKVQGHGLFKLPTAAYEWTPADAWKSQ